MFRPDYKTVVFFTRESLAHFFPASSRLHIFSSSFDSFTELSVSFVIGQSEYIILWFLFDDTQSKIALMWTRVNDQIHLITDYYHCVSSNSD